MKLVVEGVVRAFGRGRVMRVCAGLAIGLLATTRADAQFTPVSVGPDGAAANGQSYSLAVSADGRFVVFDSLASNLVPNDTNGSTDVFVRDRQMGTTTRVSVATDGSERPEGGAGLAMSATGQFVLFRSKASFVSPDSKICHPEQEHCIGLYVRDRQTNTTTRVSVKPDGSQFEHDLTTGDISGDGRFVVFIAPVTPTFENHVFLHDRQTGATTQISTTRPGMLTFYDDAIISDDGQTVIFRGPAPGTSEPTPLACPVCSVATYVYTRATGAVTTILPAFDSVHAERLPTDDVPSGLIGHVPIDVSADGRYVLIEEIFGPLLIPGPGRAFRRTLMHDRQTGRTDTSSWQSHYAVKAMSRDGRYLVSLTAHRDVPKQHLFTLEDRRSGLVEHIELPGPETPFQHIQITGFSMSADARIVAFSALHPLNADVINQLPHVYVLDRDADEDGLPSRWESTFGFDAAVNDASQDADDDGASNLEEYQRGTHPKGTSTRYFAEGAVNDFFSTRFALLNPNDVPVTVVQRFLGSGGTSSSSLRTLPARSRATIEMEFLGPAGETDFSTVIESDRPIVAERTMQWDPATRYGAHGETSVAAPATTWYLAEGATHGQFDLFYLLQNANSDPANVTVTYLRPSPLAPINKTYTVAANSRRTIWVDDEGADLASTDVAATIASDHPVIVERAMYFSVGGQSFTAGHAGVGVTAPANRWFLAEGATGSFFDLFVLIANPGADSSALSVSYLLPSGERFSKTYNVAGRSRLTISVDGEDPRLADTPVSIVVETTNGKPVVVERAMWWPQGQWHEAHLSAGATETGVRWAVADGQIGRDVVTDAVVETYLLIANTSSRPGSATVTLIPEAGSEVTHTVPLPANSRVNVPLSPLFPKDTRLRVGALVESDGVEIVVERATYWSDGDLPWTAGTATLATKRP
jgi:hypothetical protein